MLGASEAFHDQLPLGAMLCDLGLWLGTEDQDENADAGAGAGAGSAGDGSILSPLGDTLPPASTGEGEACTIDVTDDGAFNGGGCAAAAVGGPRVAAVWYPELRLKVNPSPSRSRSPSPSPSPSPNPSPSPSPSPSRSPSPSPNPSPNPNPTPTPTPTPPSR